MADDQYPIENADVDLLGSTCDELSITTVTPSVGRADIARRMLEMMQAAPHKFQFARQRGFGVQYGSLQDREDGTFLTLQGQAAYIGDEDGGDPNFGISIEVEALDKKPAPPPEEFGPFRDILGISELLGDVQGSCRAQFIYKLDESLESRILLPSPLLFSVGQNPFEFTHIESVVLSRRDADGSYHTVEVLHDPDGGHLAHIVSFSFNGPLTLEGLQGARVISEGLSKTLLKFGDDTDVENA